MSITAETALQSAAPTRYPAGFWPLNVHYYPSIFPLQPPLCLELWNHLASTSSGNAVEDELSIILPVKKKLRNSWKACGLVGCWSVMEMSTRMWAGFYYVPWQMHPASLDHLLDQTAKQELCLLMKMKWLLLWYICVFDRGFQSLWCWMLLQNVQKEKDLIFSLFGLEPEPDFTVDVYIYCFTIA